DRARSWPTWFRCGGLAYCQATIQWRPRGGTPSPRMDLRASVITLRLRHPFGLSRGTVSELPTLLVRLHGAPGDHGVGVGEASPVRYLGQSAAAAGPLAATIAAALDPAVTSDPRAIVRAQAQAR